ncbi:uncharacterized protein LOC129239334 [Anastrepha obliqua]|uniref:uncharacterized protein LOC129239334 n=1 Tax=Anastrepha obliqua TaxID=95512 RepID=UPI00240A01BC|nr:uncharacterized protein LOC129239334 [Anastrepha obliqua]
MSALSELSSCASSGSCSSPGTLSSSLSSCSPSRNVFTAEELLEKAASLPAILENGRKVFGPPLGFVGPRPSYLCELYVANLPKSLDEVRFLAWLYRCGELYEVRLMMESFSMSRGYAFVRYTQEHESLAAYELLKFVYVDGERLSVYRSQGKNRLYVSNIPKHLPLPSLEAGFKNTFRDMERCTAHASSAADSIRGELNRGFAFIEFYDHETALQAKKRTTPGRMRMWGYDLKVQWAKPKSLELNSSSSEEQKKRRSMGQLVSGQNDYCAKLRLFCLANNWCIPLVVYGRCLREKGIQYGGILLKDAMSGEFSCILMEVAVEREIQDVHVAMCEVAMQLIEENAGFPKNHYVVRLLSGFRAAIVYSCCNNTNLSAHLARCAAHFDSLASIAELAAALQVLAQYSTELILNIYKRSFLVLQSCISLKRDGSIANFYGIFPKFRNNPPLNHGFNDIEITLIVSNVTFESDHHACPAEGTDMQQYTGRKQHCLLLKSQRVRNADGYTLRYVDLDQLENREFYHLEQRINVSPIWIAGQSYQKTIFK